MKTHLQNLVIKYENSLGSEERRRILLAFMEEITVQVEFLKLDRKEGKENEKETEEAPN
jgi:hypothetical protein